MKIDACELVNVMRSDKWTEDSIIEVLIHIANGNQIESFIISKDRAELEAFSSLIKNLKDSQNWDCSK